jgi:hypothetical protein
MQLTLVGASFRPKDAKEVLASLTEGDIVQLVREPDNQYDANAIQIHYDDAFIGFVAKHEAAVIAPDMDEALADEPEYQFSAIIEAKPSRWSAILTYEGPGSDQ